MARFDADFQQTPKTRKRKVLESIDHLRTLAQEAGAFERIELRLMRRMPRYTLYEFDTERLFVPYLSHPTRAPERIPAFLFGEGRVGKEFLRFDLDALFAEHSTEVDLRTYADRTPEETLDA